MRHILLLVSLLVVSSCSVDSSPNQEEAIVGVWIINHTNSVVDYSVIEYQSNGDKCEISFSLQNHLDTNIYWNKWHLQDGVIHTTMYNTNTLLEFGYKIEDKILTLNHDELFVDMIVPEGIFDTEFHFRNHRAEPGQVCNTVRSLFNNSNKQEFDIYRDKL